MGWNNTRSGTYGQCYFSFCTTYPFRLSTTFRRGSSFENRRRFSQKISRTFRRPSADFPPRCGVITALGMSQSGLEEEAVETLLSRLLDPGQTDLCSDLSKCSSEGCGVRPRKKVSQRVQKKVQEKVS